MTHPVSQTPRLLTLPPRPTETGWVTSTSNGQSYMTRHCNYGKPGKMQNRRRSSSPKGAMHFNRTSKPIHNQMQGHPVEGLPSLLVTIPLDLPTRLRPISLVLQNAAQPMSKHLQASRSALRIRRTWQIRIESGWMWSQRNNAG